MEMQIWRPAAAVALTALLSGCAAQVAEPVLYVLRSGVPAGQTLPGDIAAPATGRTRWQLMAPVRVPEYLDQPGLLLPLGQNGVAPAAAQRWAEPLSQSVPRLLGQDLEALVGNDRMWLGPAARGLPLNGQLRVELLALDVQPGGREVQLQARWSTAPAEEPSQAGQAQPAQSHQVTLRATSAGPDTDSLVSAHRNALWQLAQAIAKTLP